MSKLRKWQFIWAEDWKVCGIVLIFCVAEIVSIIRVATNYKEFELGNLLGAFAITLVILPCIIIVFGFFWFRMARLRNCPDCKELMIRLPKPKAHKEYMQQCPNCKREIGIGVINKSGSASSSLGNELITKSSTKDDHN